MARRLILDTTIVSVVDVLDYTQRTAAVDARLIAHARAMGEARVAHDLIIAAHAVESERMIITRDARVKNSSRLDENLDEHFPTPREKPLLRHPR